MKAINTKIPLVAVVGPTASGKTAAGVILAKELGGEVISADSMQIYKGMSIATAKPTEEEMCGVAHHLIDFLPPDADFSVADYVEAARAAAMDISKRGKLPVLVGGTGLYVNSLIDNISFDDTGKSLEIRERLADFAREKGTHALWERLAEVDPETAASVHENNIPRVIRGLEVFELTGEKLSVHKTNSRLTESPFDSCIIGLGFRDRQKLYDRINRRVDEMVRLGLVDEAREFFRAGGGPTANQAIGIKELKPYLDGEESLQSCIERIKQETRHYAKRQLTWFRKRTDINWVYIDDINLLNFNEQFTKILKTIVAKKHYL